MNQQLSLRRIPMVAVLLGIVCVMGVAFAQKQESKNGDINVSLEVWKVVVKDGKESHAPAEKVNPGDTLVYIAKYHNTSGKTLKNVQAQIPIPQGLEFIPQTTHPKTVLASVDGKKFASIPLRRIGNVDGKRKVVMVPYSEYRYLRWNIDVSAKKSVQVSARVKVQN